ncbi:hypothetical protein KR026_000899 [Drosophila bipectinata]|nr:hypothetical protein KR026_000899 [Drosophila bipectinata]
MNQRHSEPFYISPRLFDNKRLKRRRCRWMERLRERQRQVMAQMRSQALTSKTERSRGRGRGVRRRPGRHIAATLPADVTIDLISDEDDEPGPARVLPIPVAVPAPVHLPVAVSVPATNHRPLVLQPNMLLIPASNLRPHYATESILITSDDEDTTIGNSQPAMRRSSPPPLAPLSLSDTVEEVTVSLVPRTSTTANCQARQRHSHPPTSLLKTCRRAPATATNGMTACASNSGSDGYLEVDINSSGLPDETTVHTVIANRIYELSLSKLREGLASSGVPEYSHDLMPEHLQKLSPALRAKVAPLVTPSPPAPISLKLSSDLSISLISDDDDCESGGHGLGHGHGLNHGPVHGTSNSCLKGGALGLGLTHPVAAAEAHAAAKLLKQQQPQLSVVQHLQYTGGGLTAPVALALPVMAHTSGASRAAGLPLQLPRRRKLG